MADQKPDVKSFAEEKFKALAEKNSWSLAYAEGFVEGEGRRRRGELFTRSILIGIDEYSLGFRAAFFERQRDSARAEAGNALLSAAQQRQLA